MLRPVETPDICRRFLTAALGAGAAALLAVMVTSVGAPSAALVLLLLAVALGPQARHWLHLAARSRVGSRSEDEVRRALAPLRGEGWRVRYSLHWCGRGDIDLVAIAPGGVAFAIEVKTSRYEDRHLVMVREQTAWLWRFRRRWCRHGVVPVLCVARARGVYRWEEGVLVVSIDRLIPTVRGTANLVHSG
ncbi:MAG: nuclease-related domain-containing protein [Solirubrobacteraceae bacterium]